jgi:hypothetical protein
VVPPCAERLHEMGADETSSPCHENILALRIHLERLPSPAIVVLFPVVVDLLRTTLVASGPQFRLPNEVPDPSVSPV